MQFLRENQAVAAKAVSKRIGAELAAGKRVLWLVCGGSNIATEVSIMKAVAKKDPDRLQQLCVIPMDERYGVSGHADSNYKQMQDAGFDPHGAIWVDILAKDLPLAETVEYYAGLVQTAFPAADYIVGVFGLGTDGHTAGVLPKTPAVYETVTSVVGYDSPPYVRLTLTPQELVKANTAYVLAYGSTKLKPLRRLRKNTEAIEDLPSKLLYDIAETYIYNDQIEDKEK